MTVSGRATTRLAGAAACAIALLAAGCDCTVRFLVPIDAEEGRALQLSARGEDLPLDACDARCVPPAEMLPAEDGPPPTTATEAGFAVAYCRLVQNGSDLAVFCQGYFPAGCS